MVLKRHLALTAALVVGSTSPAYADRSTTQDALDRMVEVLQLRIDDGTLRKPEMTPALVVRTETRYEESKDWFPNEALNRLIEVLGAKDLRLCEACMTPRVFTGDGRLEHSSGPITLEEIVRLDTMARGDAEAAKTAIWVDEQATGVSVKIVELATARVLFAQNIDPMLREQENTEGLMRLSAELERRARGDSLTHAFVDLALLPSQHISFDWTDQWGEENKNFTGITISAFDPVFGVGVAYYRVFGVFHIADIPFAPQFGGKVVVSLPTAIVNAVAPDDAGDLIDPILTGVGVIRVPFGTSNYALVATLSTNARFAIGISLLNISFLPVIP
ncbi:MAG: hypothetical protein RMA76_11550 [Deltaproteobacteria bacterium]